MFYCYHDSPVGRLLLAGEQGCLKVVSFSSGKHVRQPQPEWQENERVFHAVVQQLDEYFAGERRDFDLDLQPDGTAFQKAVWDALRDIPYGETASYGDIARRIGRPKAVRAVGAANGLNPIPIIIPCHRVIGANGKLTGYGGGLPVKEKLLSLEANQTDDLFAAV